MERFRKLVLQIQDLNPEVTLHHMLTALRPERFGDSLYKKSTSNLEELKRRAGKFMQLEELREFRNQVSADSQREKGKMKERPLSSHQFTRPKEIRT